VRILVVGDSFMPPRYFRESFAGVELEHDVTYAQVDATQTFVATTASEQRIRESQGSPAELVGWMPGIEVLVVQGAPVTDEVIAASDQLRLVCCARGGPVNVDVEAVNGKGLPLVITPGKNAEAVADLALAFLVMTARRLSEAQRFLHEGNDANDNWVGARFIGSDLRRHVLGLVGFGQVGPRVAARALAFGLEVIVFDPYVEVQTFEQVASLGELLERSDFVSLHARATPETEKIIDAAAFATMKPGAVLVNTARETLVDEEALDLALASGQLGGAALDLVRERKEPGPHPLLRHNNVVITPHVGGATHETLLQGAEMIAEEISRFAAGEPLVYVMNSHPTLPE